MTVMAEGLEWLRVYWVSGQEKRGSRFSNAVSSPPCSGWMFAVQVVGPKRSVLFCPYTFESFQVSNDCGEIRGAKADQPFNPVWFERHLREKWAEMQARGWFKDYDTAALVFKRMGWEVPEQVMKGGEEDTRKKGGKEVEVQLKKPVKLSGKRGQFLVWFLEKGGSAPVREAMAEFGMTRSNALSYLYMLTKDHGIGYELVGDTATVTLPEGVENPFDEPWAATGTAPVPAEDDDDSWLEG
jgi:hypothetical protein